MASSHRARSHVPRTHSDNEKVTSADTYGNSWIMRYNDINFKCNGVYHGVVETILSKGAAVVVIGEKERGIPLLWNDNWCRDNVKFAKVLLLVDRLRPSIDQPEYDKDTFMRDKVKEGEVLFVVVEETKRNLENIYKYIASSAFKIETTGKIFNESVMLRIRDPLRGIVEYASEDAGIVRFGTYNGLIAKAHFSVNSLKKSSRNVKGNTYVKNVMPVNTLVFVEVVKWHWKARVEEWEKLLFRDGILFKATLVWSNDKPRSELRGGEEKKVTETERFVPDKKERGFKGSVDVPSHFGVNAKGDQETNYSLSDCHAYCGVIEIIPSVTVAIICTAHRRGEPLSWKDNWFAKGVNMERVLLISDHLRTSKCTSECAKGTPIKSVLQKGDYVRVVVEPTAKIPDKCYRWFAKTCWKETDEVGRIPSIPLYLLPDHLCGEVESIISFDMGIISFKTYHGHAAKAFFSHKSYYKNGRKILHHIPLGSEVNKRTKVHLIVDKWHSGRNSKEVEKNIKDVNYRVVMAWEMGTTRPDESEPVERKDGAKTDFNQKLDHVLDKNEIVNSSATHKGRRGGGLKMPARGMKQFAGKRGGVKQAGFKPSQSRYKNDDSKSCGDSVDLSDSLSDLVDFLGSASVSTENLSSGSSCQSESKFPLHDQALGQKNYLMAGKTDNSLKCLDPLNVSSNPFTTGSSSQSGSKFPLHDQALGKKNYLMAGKTDNSLKCPDPLNVSANPFINVNVPYLDDTKTGTNDCPLKFPAPLNISSNLDGTKTATLISIDESWGLVQVAGDDDVHGFQSDAVYMYGLKLEDVPLHRLFHEGQNFRVHMEEGKIVALEYGAPQLPNLLRKAISVYCENNSTPDNVRYKLDSIMSCYGV